MSNYYIRIRNAELAYPATTYNALTLKEEVFKFFRIGKPTKLLYDIHAIKNMTLDINEGERLGIIGRNGAGKSSLLKAIAGIYPLQSGSIETSGKIRSMFELSLGFEFEASGRENILYRGLLLGESPESVREKIDEIIAFAELGEFIDYPIKAYSAGMLVRLAFSISTTIRGDILLMDEILAAGDAGFQVKAQKRMEELINNAKIIVLVSHDLAAVEKICNRAIYISSGEIVADGKASDVVREYRNSMNAGVVK
ncbi:MAG: ABC transporter ATP-binding protein [Anaerolineales bacterium]|nr:ABC transporter ATP-binding protein [Anaerolineales bacterium]